MCLQFSVDNYLLQVQGWALTEYGDSLQSVVATKAWKTNSFNVHSSMRDIVSKEVLITLHLSQLDQQMIILDSIIADPLNWHWNWYFIAVKYRHWSTVFRMTSSGIR